MKHNIATLFGIFALAIGVLGQGAELETGRFNLPASPLAITTGSNYTINSAWIELKQRAGGFAIAPYFATTNASTSNVVFTVEISINGVAPQIPITTKTLTYTPALTGTTAVMGYTNFTGGDISGHLITSFLPNDIANVRWFRLKSINSATALGTVWVTNVYWVKVRE